MPLLVPLPGQWTFKIGRFFNYSRVLDAYGRPTLWCIARRRRRC